MDGYIIPVGPTSVVKILRLDATILPDQSLEPKKDNIWNVDGLEIEKEGYQIDTFSPTQDLVLGQIISQAWRCQYVDILKLRHAIRSSQDGGERT